MLKTKSFIHLSKIKGTQRLTSKIQFPEKWRYLEPKLLSISENKKQEKNNERKLRYEMQLITVWGESEWTNIYLTKMKDTSICDSSWFLKRNPHHTKHPSLWIIYSHKPRTNQRDRKQPHFHWYVKIAYEPATDIGTLLWGPPLLMAIIGVLGSWKILKTVTNSPETQKRKITQKRFHNTQHKSQNNCNRFTSQSTNSPETENANKKKNLTEGVSLHKTQITEKLE